MAKYVNVDEYCEKRCRCKNEYCDKQSCPIWKAPAADVAPVVRCKDCEYSWEDIGGLTCSYGCCVDCVVREDFFCADGVKREVAND